MSYGGNMKDHKNETASDEKKSSNDASKKYKVLLVDDNYEFYQIVQLSLGEYLEIDYAGDGFTAFQMVKRNTYDVVICDILMPLINGLALLHEFKKKQIAIPFLFVTGNANDKVIREAFHAGAYNLIEKPFDKEDLLEKVENAVKLHKSERTGEITDQDRAYIYNTLKMYYYDVEKIIRSIHTANMPVSAIHQELEKKVRTGKCIFDDLQGLRFYKNVN